MAWYLDGETDAVIGIGARTLAWYSWRSGQITYALYLVYLNQSDKVLRMERDSY